MSRKLPTVYIEPTAEEKRKAAEDHAKTVKGVRANWAKVMHKVRANYMQDSKIIFVDKA